MVRVEAAEREGEDILVLVHQVDEEATPVVLTTPTLLGVPTTALAQAPERCAR